jgi:hypothetical protein
MKELKMVMNIPIPIGDEEDEIRIRSQFVHNFKASSNSFFISFNPDI